MVLKALPKETLKRLRETVKKQQQKTGKPFLERALRFFRRLRNADQRTRKEKLIDLDGANNRLRTREGPGYAVRELRVKGTNGVILKYPTLAQKGFQITRIEEIGFIRKLVDLINKKCKDQGFLIQKPEGHQVGPFIAMQKSNFPTIENFIIGKPTYDATEMLTRLSKEMQMPREKVREKLTRIAKTIESQTSQLINDGKIRLSKKYPVGEILIANDENMYFLVPLDKRHLQVTGQKNGVIQLLPYIDAV